MKSSRLRIIPASILAPGLPALAAYYIVSHRQMQLPDNFGSQVFLFYAVCFYVAAMPAFWVAYSARTSLITYSIIGMFVTWLLWMHTLLLPSDASVCPLNPQFSTLRQQRSLVYCPAYFFSASQGIIVHNRP